MSELSLLSNTDMRAITVYNKDREELCIPTGSDKLDQALGNGIRLGTVTELVGSSGCGKTQMCLKLAFNTILPRIIGVVDGDVLYISTKRNFHPLRVNQLAEVYVKAFKKFGNQRNYVSKESNTFIFTKESALARIHHKLVLSLEDLIATVYKMQKNVADVKNVSTSGFQSQS